MFNIKSNNPNYLAKIVKLPKLQNHPNADRLQICNLLGNSIITGLAAKEGDVYVYFPLESSLNTEYLSWSNSFADAELNRDKTKKGFFSDSGRVKACRLRGSKSEGYIVPLTDLQEWLRFCGKDFEITEDLINKDFDSFDNILICEKHVNRQELYLLHKERLAQSRKDKKKVRVSKIIEDQFRLSQDVEQLGRNLNKLNPEDFISISVKMHGSNGVISRVLCKKPLSWRDKLFKFFGANIVDSHYDLVFSSRTVIKNAYFDKDQGPGYYDSNIWAVEAQKVKNSLFNGISLMGEIVGYTPKGSCIQKDYDYGCEVGQSKFFVFRVTYTNPSGKVFEFSWQQIKDYCAKFNLNHVEELYYGKAKDLFGETVKVDENWRENFYQALRDRYLEKDCYICRNKVPFEGIVLTIQKGHYEPFKLKSFNFLARESKQLDDGVVSIEDTEANVITEHKLT